MPPKNHLKRPKIIISYSWTSETHTQWVADLGENLASDGVEVVLDQWDLEEGHDLNAFMEKMVNDPTINRVIIISDRHVCCEGRWPVEEGSALKHKLFLKKFMNQLIRVNSFQLFES